MVHSADDRGRSAPLGPSFWRLWTSSGLSNLADGILKVALPLVAVRITDSPTAIAGLALALTMPWLLFALPAGALADRVDRRRAMLIANAGRAALLAGFVLALVLGAGSIWPLYIVAFSVGVAETIYDTSAQSILPQVVSRSELSRANGHLYAAELTTNQFIGPPLGGLIVAAGAVLAFSTPVALWVAAVLVLSMVRGSFRVDRSGPATIRADILEGLRFLWRNRILRTLAVMVGVFNFAGNAIWAVFVLFAVGQTSAMGLSDPEYGLLLITVAVGSVAGSLVGARVERSVGRARSMVLATVGNVVMIIVPALAANPVAIGAAFVLGGFGASVWNIITVSLRQRITPDALLGRVNSGYRMLAWGTMPLGAAAGGVLAQSFGLRAVFVVMGALTLANLAGMLVVTDAGMAAAERAAAER